jgi:hypothetical protein
MIRRLPRRLEGADVASSLLSIKERNGGRAVGLRRA